MKYTPIRSFTKEAEHAAALPLGKLKLIDMETGREQVAFIQKWTICHAGLSAVSLALELVLVEPVEE